MSEVMICRGSSGAGGDEKKKVFKREIIENNMIWTVPDIVNNEVYVRVFGAGGYIDPLKTENGEAGGGSGWLNNGTVKLIKGGSVTITVGKNGGESTSFGSFLVANGGSGCDGGSAGCGIYSYGYYTTAFQFGGSSSYKEPRYDYSGWCGGVWGGGGGGSGSYQSGNGGKYGGGGGTDSGFAGIGGMYGGNGGNSSYKAENGTNTIGWTNVDKDIATGEYMTGPGLAGYLSNDINNRYERGGGGFGGCGGCLIFGDRDNPGISGYGGGGYCGNSYSYGGGGYGKGADAYSDSGAGYFTPSNACNGAGWGKYGYGMYCSRNDVVYNAGPGVCVIEYYVWEDSKSK